MMIVSTTDASTDLVTWGISLAVPAISAFIGIIVGAWLTSQRNLRQHRLTFVENQLQRFYSPMLGIRNEIRMRSELRVRIQDAATSEWARLSERAASDVAALRNLESTRGPEFQRVIDYDNRQLENELLPAYRQMAALFRDNYFLADDDTRDYYAALIQYVELWNRRMEDSIPIEVTTKLGHTEAKLHGFYKHLEDRHRALRNKLEFGEV